MPGTLLISLYIIITNVYVRLLRLLTYLLTYVNMSKSVPEMC